LNTSTPPCEIGFSRKQAEPDDFGLQDIADKWSLQVVEYFVFSQTARDFEEPGYLECFDVKWIREFEEGCFLMRKVILSRKFIGWL
jgi:hypothetical protein